MNDVATSGNSKEKLVQDLRVVLHDVESLTRESADQLSGRARELYDQATVRIKDARAKIQELEGTVREKAIEGAKETDRIIRDHPYESLGVAFGLGILLGVLLNRR